jgi:hypothetical protein
MQKFKNFPGKTAGLSASARRGMERGGDRMKRGRGMGEEAKGRI